MKFAVAAKGAVAERLQLSSTVVGTMETDRQLTVGAQICVRQSGHAALAMMQFRMSFRGFSITLLKRKAIPQSI